MVISIYILQIPKIKIVSNLFTIANIKDYDVAVLIK